MPHNERAARCADSRGTAEEEKHVDIAQADHDSLTAKVLRRPERREIAAPVQEQLIVELYSK